MILYLDLGSGVIGVIAMFAINCVSEDIAIEPFGVIEGDVEVDFAIICLSDSDMSYFFDFLFVELVSGCNFSLISFQDSKGKVVRFGLGVIVVCGQCHVEVALMWRPLNVEDGFFPDDVYK